MWRVIARTGSPTVVISGPSGRHHFDVFKGRFCKVCWQAIRAIQSPAMRRALPEGFQLSSPLRVGAYDNTGPNRRFLILKPPGRANVILRLSRQGDTYSEAFYRSLRDAIVRRIEPGTTNAEVSRKSKESGARGGYPRHKGVST